MKKLSILTIVLLLLTAGIVTAKATDSIILWRSNGEKITINFSERPKLTFGKGEIKITTNNHEVAYPAEEVLRCTYESTSSNIEHINAGTTPTLSFAGNNVIISGLSAASPVAVYNTAGQMLCSQQADSSGKTQVDITSLPSGVYIIKTSVGNFKIRKS